jgi:hypothetical protein
MKRITQLLHSIHHGWFQLLGLETMQGSDSKWSYLGRRQIWPLSLLSLCSILLAFGVVNILSAIA